MLEEVPKDEHEKAYILLNDDGQLITNDGFSKYTTKMQFNNPSLIDESDKHDPRCLL